MNTGNNIDSESLKTYGQLPKSQHDPFEFKVLETLLSMICQHYEEKLQIINPVCHKLLESVASQTNEDGLMRLVPLERSLIAFEYSLKEFRSAIDGLLASDEDLSNLYITDKSQSKRQRDREDHTEAEILLENYAKKGINCVCVCVLTFF
jgi:magnesium transporter